MSLPALRRKLPLPVVRDFNRAFEGRDNWHLPIPELRFQVLGHSRRVNLGIPYLSLVSSPGMARAETLYSQLLAGAFERALV